MRGMLMRDDGPKYILALPRLVIFKERAGIISADPVWVAIINGKYLYTADTILSLIKEVSKNWKDDRYLVG